MTIRLSADQMTATIPPTKAVRVRFVNANNNTVCCEKCHLKDRYRCDPHTFPCIPSYRNDGRNGYWAKAKKGKRVGK
jgi:hypothetical protein